MVDVPPTWEGSFNLDTTNDAAVVRFNNDTNDPENRHRERRVDGQRSGASARGHTSWGPWREGQTNSRLNAKSTNAPILLTIL